MGIFSDKCQALIDPATGKALTGEALEQARGQRKAPHCGNRVSKAARFCNVCGSPAPGGWWRCPQCGKWIGNEAQFCSHCDARLYPEQRAGMAGGVWSRSPGTCAERFEVGDIKRLLKNGIQVQEGTAAIVLNEGAVKDVLKPGPYNPDSLARKINHWGSPPPRSVILVDNGDFVLPLRIEGLRSAEQFPIEFYGEAILQFAPKGAEEFVGNLFKDARHLAYADIADMLAGGIRHAIDAHTATVPVEELVRDPGRRQDVEDALRAYLGGQLKRLGLELVAVSAADFSGEEYEELAEKAGEVEQTRRRMEFDQQVGELAAKDAMHKYKTETDLKQYVTQLAHEAQVSDHHREVEIERLTRLWRHEKEVDEQLHTRKIEHERQQHEIDMAGARGDHTRGERVKDAEADAAVAGIKAKQVHTEAFDAMKLRELKNMEKERHQREIADIRKGMSDMGLLATVTDPAQRDALLRLFELKMKEGSTPEQILAMAADDSPAAAQALQQMAAQKRHDQEEYLQKMQELYRDAMDRHERTLKTYIEPANRAASGSSDVIQIND